MSTLQTLFLKNFSELTVNEKKMRTKYPKSQKY